VLFGGFPDQSRVQRRGRTNYELATELSINERLGDLFLILRHIPNDICKQNNNSIGAPLLD
jgi:hypothetical protein